MIINFLFISVPPYIFCNDDRSHRCAQVPWLDLVSHETIHLNLDGEPIEGAAFPLQSSSPPAALLPPAELPDSKSAVYREVIPVHPTPAAASNAAAVIFAGGVQFFNLQNTVYHPC